MDGIIAAIVVLCVIGLSVLTVAFGITSGNLDQIRQQAIEHGYAQYCPTTGKWAWANECNTNP